VLFIHPDSRHCDVFGQGSAPNDAALWVLDPSDPGQTVRLASVEMGLIPSVLWEDVPEAIKPI
jgi:hypothetical protein